MDIANEIMMLNQKYEENNANGIKPENARSNYKIILGKIPIFLSASHAVRQQREGKEKIADGVTGGITEYLCDTCNCYGIIRNYNLLEDPNKDIIGIGLRYKEKMLSIIKENQIILVIDIHGCKDTYNFDFSIGTNSGKNLNGKGKVLEILKKELGKIGKVVIDEKFKASLDGNISKYISENANIPSIQLEISNKFRTQNLYLEQLVMCLQEIIKKINNDKD